jgi:hypothetical protein
LKRSFFSTGLLFVAMASSMSAFAKDKSTDVQIYQPTQVGTATLQPGLYRVTVNSTGSASTVTFMKNGKQVADVQGQPVQLARKSANTSLTLDNSGKVPRVSEIDFEGQTTAVGFAAPAVNASASE